MYGGAVVKLRAVEGGEAMSRLCLFSSNDCKNENIKKLVVSRQDLKLGFCEHKSSEFLKI